jgi:hypothetical protein
MDKHEPDGNEIIDAATDTDMDGRWLSYRELAELRGIDAASALKLSRRRGWRRRKNNQGQMQVCVPANVLPKRDKGMDGAMDASIDMSRIISTFETVTASLTKRAETAEATAAAERARANRAEELAAATGIELQRLAAELATAVERRTATETEARTLREAENQRQQLGRWRRAWAGWRGR